MTPVLFPSTTSDSCALSMDKAQESLVVAALSGLLSHLLKQSRSSGVQKIILLWYSRGLHLHVCENSGTRLNALFGALHKILCCAQRYHIVKNPL